MSLPVSNKPSGSAHYHGVSFHIGTPRHERVSESYDNRDDAVEWASAQKERYEGVMVYIAIHEPVVSLSD